MHDCNTCMQIRLAVSEICDIFLHLLNRSDFPNFKVKNSNMNMKQLCERLFTIHVYTLEVCGIQQKLN